MFAEKARAPGSREEKASCVLLQPWGAWARPSLPAQARLVRAAQIPGGSRQIQAALAGSSRGRLPRRGAVCRLEVRTVGMVHADYTHPCPRFCYYFVLIVRRFPGRGSKGAKLWWQKEPLPRQAVGSFAPGPCLCWWQGLGGGRGQASLQTGWLTVGMAGLGDAACEVAQP